MSNPTSSSRPDRRKLWISLLWFILLAKSVFLTWAIQAYEMPLQMPWVWLTALIAGGLFTYVLWTAKPPETPKDETAETESDASGI